MGARFRRIMTAHDAQGRSIISGAAPPTQALRFAGEVDAAIDFGGPVEASSAPDRSMLQFGMGDIVGNVVGYDQRRETAEVMNASSWSLRPLLDEDRNTPMLVINDAGDTNIPQHDTLVFQGRPETEVHLFHDAGHCAPTKPPEITPIIARWLTSTFAAPKWSSNIRIRERYMRKSLAALAALTVPKSCAKREPMPIFKHGIT